MKESTTTIQDFVSYQKVNGASDLTRKQRDIVVSMLIQEEPAEDLVEHLIEHEPPKDLRILLSRLYFADKSEALMDIVESLKQMTKKALDYHYDDKINEVISDYNWEKRQERISRYNISEISDIKETIQGIPGLPFSYMRN